MKELVNPIPSIINQLGCLAIDSMQQLDTALRWPTEIRKETNTTDESTTFSPLIEYPQSYQTTLLQIIQQLANALRAVKSKSDQVVMELTLAPDYIGTLNRYLNQYLIKNKSIALSKLLRLPLNRLNDLAEKIALLSSESASKFQGVANLTKAFAKTTKSVLSAKLVYMQNKLSSSFSRKIVTKTNYKNELEKNITVLNEVHQRWIQSVTELENKTLSLKE